NGEPSSFPDIYRQPLCSARKYQMDIRNSSPVTDSNSRLDGTRNFAKPLLAAGLSVILPGLR
ncbi:MAG: hypothetical protein J2P18_00565, partial [Nocardia sp.]|nr:hypothetical protein [Nocardia sp.]